MHEFKREFNPCRRLRINNAVDAPVLAELRARKPLHVWTEVTTDQGNRIVSGARYVNRVRYIITEQPANSSISYEISL